MDLSLNRAAAVVQKRYRSRAGRLREHQEDLVISDLRAHNLRCRRAALPSAYMVVTLERSCKESENEAQSTPVRPNDTQPRWAAKLTFEKVPRPAILRIEVYDRETDRECDAEDQDCLIAMRRVRLAGARGCMRHVQLLPVENIEATQVVDVAAGGEGDLAPSADVIATLRKRRLSRLSSERRVARLALTKNWASMGALTSAWKSGVLKTTFEASFDYDTTSRADCETWRAENTLTALAHRLRAGLAADLEGGMIVVLGTPSLLKDAFCDRIAARTKGTVLSVRSLLSEPVGSRSCRDPLASQWLLSLAEC